MEDPLLLAARAEPSGPYEFSDALERGTVVYFPESPVPFPSRQDLDFLREEMPSFLRRKNLSYHPEVDRAVGVGGTSDQRRRLRALLREHSDRVTAYLTRVLPAFAPGWQVATASFRPFQEKGRDLPAHASNERVHVDAKAYGATYGRRILRFFMNANPVEDRVWITKGAFPEVYRRYAARAGIAPSAPGGHDLSPGVVERLFSGALDLASRCGLPLLKLADSSPYDRLMRRFHNFMKDTPEFQSSPVGHREFRFPPFSAWMVFTDMLTHACVSGRHAFIDTYLIPLESCRHPDQAPYRILESPIS
jgi:hypothetical protein